MIVTPKRQPPAGEFFEKTGTKTPFFGACFAAKKNISRHSSMKNCGLPSDITAQGSWKSRFVSCRHAVWPQQQLAEQHTVGSQQSHHTFPKVKGAT